MRLVTLYSYCFSLLLLTCFRANAQHNATKDRSYPSVVLVQLSSEQNRMKALKSGHLYKQLKQLKKDARGAQKATIADFRDHFVYCPVYYYMDTNLNKVIKRDFNGILFDNRGEIVQQQILSPSDTDFLIVYYGYPVPQRPKGKLIRDESAYSHSTHQHWKGLVINNFKFEQFNYIGQRNKAHFSPKKYKHNKYYYTSPIFDIEYHPLAAKLVPPIIIPPKY